MHGIAPVLRFHGAPRARSVGRVALTVILAVTALLGAAPATRADGPLTLVTSVKCDRGGLPPCVASLGSRAHDIVIDGIPGITGKTFAFVATDKGLTILDISDPVNPQVRGSELSVNCNVDCTRGPVAKSQGLAKKGQYVYLAAGLAGMQVIDVLNPDNPQTIASAIADGHPLNRPDGVSPTTLAPKGGKIYDIAVHPTANAAYAASYNGEVHVWDISNPAAPLLTQTLGVMLWGGGVCDICVAKMFAHVENGTAYVTGVSTAGNRVVAVDWGYGGLYDWDSTDPLRLRFLGTHRLKVSMYRVEVDLARDVAYMLGAFWINSGLLTAPLSPLEDSGVTYCATLGGIPPPAPASTAPACDGGDTCIECGQVRTTTPTGSALVGDGGGIGFSSNGKYAFYVGGRGNGELAIIDVRDQPHTGCLPGSMEHLCKVASVAPGPMNLQLAEAAGIVARNDYLYVTAGPFGVQVYHFPGLGSSAP